MATSGKKIEGVSRAGEPLDCVKCILLQLDSVFAMQSSAKFYSQPVETNRFLIALPAAERLTLHYKAILVFGRFDCNFEGFADL